MFQSYGLFINPLELEFGWTRVVTSGASSMLMLIAGGFSIFAGRLADKFGPRIIISVCGCFIGLAFLLMAQLNSIWQLYLFYGLIAGIGGSGAFVPTVSTVVRWFDKRRVLMSGIVSSGLAASTMTIVPLVSRLILTYGWRTSFTILGILGFTLIISAAQFLKHDPSRKGLLPYGSDELKLATPRPVIRSSSLRQAVSTKPFWMLWSIFFISFFTNMIITVHIIPYATNLGISTVNAANILVIRGGFTIAGTVILGAIADRIGKKPVLIFSLIVRTAVFCGLIIAKDIRIIYLIVAILGFATGGSGALMSPMVAQIFGLSSLGAIFAGVQIGGLLGGTISPILAGQIFDITGNYQISFLINAIVCFIGLIPALLIRLK